jgi:hypothetical protein
MNGRSIACEVLGRQENLVVEVKEMAPALVYQDDGSVDDLQDGRLGTVEPHDEVVLISGGAKTGTKKAYGLEGRDDIAVGCLESLGKTQVVDQLA